MIEKNQKYSLLVPTVFIWIGFICSISFMEAWLKFRAPLVTKEIGLSIGVVVFSALNRVEWVFSLLAFIFGARGKLFTLILLILAVQTIWLMPMLSERAAMIISGQAPAASCVHIVYIALEVAKVLLLFFLGMLSQKR